MVFITGKCVYSSIWPVQTAYQSPQTKQRKESADRRAQTWEIEDQVVALKVSQLLLKPVQIVCEKPAHEKKSTLQDVHEKAKVVLSLTPCNTPAHHLARSSAPQPHRQA